MFLGFLMVPDAILGFLIVLGFLMLYGVPDSSGVPDAILGFQLVPPDVKILGFLLVCLMSRVHDSFIIHVYIHCTSPPALSVSIRAGDRDVTWSEATRTTHCSRGPRCTTQ